MKGVRAEKVTRRNWSGRGPDALKVGEVVPQLVGPLRGEGTNPLETEFNTGVKGKSRHPSARDVQALSRRHRAKRPQPPAAPAPTSSAAEPPQPLGTLAAEGGRRDWARAGEKVLNCLGRSADPGYKGERRSSAETAPYELR